MSLSQTAGPGPDRLERLVRTTLVSTIYGGTSEIQRNIIAKTLGL